MLTLNNSSDSESVNRDPLDHMRNDLSQKKMMCKDPNILGLVSYMFWAVCMTGRIKISFQYCFYVVHVKI